MADLLPDQSTARHWIATAPAGANVLVMQHVTYNAEVTQAYRDKGWRIEGPFVPSSISEEWMHRALDRGDELARLRAENVKYDDALTAAVDEVEQLRVENEALRASLAWAVNWIDYSHEIPLKAEEPSDFEKWTAAYGLARASDDLHQPKPMFPQGAPSNEHLLREGVTPDEQEAAPHPETVCRRCGGPNVSWFAPSPLWNAVMRGGSIDGPQEFDELICPTCFAVLAEERGIACDWRLEARTVNVALETTTPSGRTWDPGSDLWAASPSKDATEPKEGR